MPHKQGRARRPWRRLPSQVLAASDTCHLCGRRSADTVDHIIPISVDDSLTLDPANLRPAHRSCTE